MTDKCAEIFEYSRKLDKIGGEVVVITGNQTVVSCLWRKIYEEQYNLDTILLWNGKLTPVNQHNDPDWLLQFDLGDLYMRGELV